MKEDCSFTELTQMVLSQVALHKGSETLNSSPNAGSFEDNQKEAGD